MANEEQAEYWNGEETSHWVDNEVRYDEMLGAFGARVIDAAAIGAPELVLDVGCGNGWTTLAAARAATGGEAFGIDLSEGMLGRARARARDEGLTNVRFVVADAQTTAFDQPFDVVISRFGVMFFDDPVAAFSNVRRASNGGARLAFACWKDVFSNEWIAAPMGAALEHVPPPPFPQEGEPGPFSLGDPERVRGILGDAGWSDVALEALEVPILVGGRGSVADALDFIGHTGMGKMLLAGDDPDASARALDAIRDVFEQHHNGTGVELGAAAWIVTART